IVLPAETAMPRIILGVPFRGRRLVRGTTRPGGGSHGARRVDSIRPCDGVRLMLLSAVTESNGRPAGRIEGTSPGAGECPMCGREAIRGLGDFGQFRRSAATEASQE